MNNITSTQLKAVVQESLREVFEQELMKFRSLLIPSVSAKEQKEIEKALRKADRRVAKSIRVAV